MKKAFDQTFRDIKRGVNKKVLKVPSIEQKVLDATSNEPWGPHGTHLADIAQASRNYHEYQMIMSVVWKRLKDSGKNWRHVYKGLTVLEYLVANGSERVIEDIREHAYQISILSSFQYIDSTGRDQGSNVRKKSQSLVALVNDKEKIQEARDKAAASRDKFRNTSGGPGDDQYEGRYGSRDEDRNGYGRERDWNYRDSYGRDGEDRYGRDGYRDDEYHGRSQNNDGDYGPRSQSADRDRERAYEDDGHLSSRGSNARVEDGSPDGSRLEPKLSGQSLSAPPSYEDAVSEGRSPPPQPAVNHQETTDSSNSAPPPPAAATPPLATATPPPAAATPAATSNTENEGFDLFDPRGPPPAAPSASGGAEVDLFGSLSDSFSSNALALVPSETHAPTNPNPSQTFIAASPASQPFDDPFGDGPFRAVPSTEGFSSQPPASPFTEPPQAVAQTTVNEMGFGDSFDQTIDILADILPPTGPSPTLPSQTVIQAQPGQLSTQIVFPSQISQPNQTAFSSSFPGQFGQPMSQPAFPVQGGYQSIPPPSFPAQGGQPVLPRGFPVAQGDQSVLPPGFLAAQVGQSELPPGFPAQGGQSVLPPGFPAAQGGQSVVPSGFAGGQNASLGGISSQLGTVSQAGFSNSNGHTGQPNNNFYGGFQPQGQPTPAPTPPAVTISSFYQQPQLQSSTSMAASPAAVTASTGALAIVPQQPAKEKFETKSTVWADTLNRGLVNLNISGSKTNPLSDIGIDFEAINRKEKRMEKPSKTPVTSNVTMGKAMGSGSGIGRAGAGALRPAPNPMVGSGMGITMGAPGAGPGFGAGYGGVNQPMGMNNMPQNMGIGMNIGQGFQMQPPPGTGFLPPGNYNPMLGRGGGYGQQPYGGYR